MSIKVIKVISRRDVLREAQRNKHVFSTWAVISVNAYAGAFTDANVDGSEKSPFDVAEIPTGWRINLNFDDISAEEDIVGRSGHGGPHVRRRLHAGVRCGTKGPGRYLLLLRRPSDHAADIGGC